LGIRIEDLGKKINISVTRFCKSKSWSWLLWQHFYFGEFCHKVVKIFGYKRWKTHPPLPCLW